RQDVINVMKALNRLPDRSLRAFRLSRIEGLTYAEIAARLGVATSTAYGLVADALVEVTLAANK
ncbi:MAG: sigma factor-like helix-turn-helix DNA-binding protein, partial [Pseudomonadota bacterium]